MGIKIVILLAFAAVVAVVTNGRAPPGEMSGGEVDKAFLHPYHFRPYHGGVFGGYRGGIGGGFGRGFGGVGGMQGGGGGGGDDGGIAGTGAVEGLESGATSTGHDDAFGDDVEDGAAVVGAGSPPRT